jgi:hypothetical protein
LECQMTKPKCQSKSKVQTSGVGHWEFDVPLTFEL